MECLEIDPEKSMSLHASFGSTCLSKSPCLGPHGHTMCDFGTDKECPAPQYADRVPSKVVQPADDSNCRALMSLTRLLRERPDIVIQLDVQHHIVLLHPQDELL